ncbi:hypothetical protein [Bacillus solimangrovi]
MPLEQLLSIKRNFTTKIPSLRTALYVSLLHSFSPRAHNMYTLLRLP